MLIEFDTGKRNKTLAERGLTFPVLTRCLLGGAGLDTARRGSPHHFHEVRQ